MHAKRYEMAMKEANRTKLINLAIGETSSAAKEKIDQLTKKVENYFTNQQQQQPQNLRIAITVEFLATGKKIAESYNKTNKTGVINVTLHHNNLITNHYHHQLTIYQDPNIKTTIINLLHSQCNNHINNSPFNITKPNHYHTQPSYLKMPEKQDFHHTAFSEDRATAQQQNPSKNNTTIPPTRIAENANFSDIFLFEFEANKSPFLLNNAAANKQKAITAMYTKAEVEGKPIHLILDSGSAENWETQELQISYQGQHTQVPVTCDTFNKCSEKAPAFKFKPEAEKPLIKTFMALESTSNWADKTEQEHFTPHSKPETHRWNIPYSKPEPRK
ncbi:hypothetical protein G9A89_022214 [Geosiphon pyriformis]|nr:hypothetical protein G9A89_022214 [Geosiphon pyriformis]